MEQQKREYWVDYMKAFACLSVLIFHVIYGMQNAGLEPSKPFVILKQFCDVFQIPAFMYASGYLFGKRSMGNYVLFNLRKLWNLGVPYVVFSFVYYFINTHFSSSVNFSYTTQDLLLIYKSPLAQYWFIMALFILFLTIPILERIFRNEFVLLGILFLVKILNTYWYSIDGIQYDDYFAKYACYFYLGTIYARHHETFSIKKENSWNFLPIAVILVFIVVSPWVCSLGNEYDLIFNFGCVLAIYLATGLVEKAENKLGNKFIKLISKYSFQIYLMHTMATAAIRILLMKMQITLDYIQFILGIAGGLGASLLAAIICEKTVVLNIIFFPEGTIKRIKAIKQD